MGQPAAHKSATTLHGPPLKGTGCPKVKIANKAAWRVGDVHTCSLANPPPGSTPHVGGSVLKGSFTVLIGNRPATRQTDVVIEPAALAPPPNNTIMLGEPTVHIGDIAFGMMDPANLGAFCAEWSRLLADWAGLTPQQRRERMKALLDNALRRSGAPPLTRLTSKAAKSAKGSFSPGKYRINMPRAIFKKATPPAGNVAQTLIHEARHAEQWFNSARWLAGRGASANTIAARMGIPLSTARAAAANPARVGTAAGQHGLMNFRQSYGGGRFGRSWDRALRDAQRQAFQAHGVNSPQYAQAYENYFGMPNERDAQDAAEALAAGCPAAN